MQYLQFIVNEIKLQDDNSYYCVAYHRNGDMVTFQATVYSLYSEFVKSVEDYYDFEEYLINS